MDMQIQGTFECKKWDEKPISEAQDGRRLARASVINEYQGDVAGQGVLEYLLFYNGQEDGSFIGLEQVSGQVGDRRGSFVLQHHGVFHGYQIEGSLSIVPDSGTGDLQGLQGEGRFVAQHGQAHTPFSLTCRFE